MKLGHVTFTIKPLQQYFVMILLILPSKLQGSTLALARSPLESNISEWNVKKANEPKILARSGNYF